MANEDGFVQAANEAEKMQMAREAHMERSKQIVKNCEFRDLSLSDRALQANIGVTSLFEEFTEALTLYLPEGYRSALVLEHLESACMYAKKAIQVHDQYLSKLNAQQNGDQSSNSK